MKLFVKKLSQAQNKHFIGARKLKPLKGWCCRRRAVAAGLMLREFKKLVIMAWNSFSVLYFRSLSNKITVIYGTFLWVQTVQLENAYLLAWSFGKVSTRAWNSDVLLTSHMFDTPLRKKFLDLNWRPSKSIAHTFIN